MKTPNINYKKLGLSAALGIVISFVLYYIFLPPINIHSVGFWIYLAIVLLSFSIPYLGISLDDGVVIYENDGKGKMQKKKVENIRFKDIKFNKIAVIIVLVPIAIAIIGGIFSSTVFFARKYASVITVTESTFDELPETSDNFDHIALMDTDSATKLGNRELGALSHVVSQYTLSSYYTQINYQNYPKKVTNLEYDNFFKWLINRKDGVPGMVMVDPVNPDATYMEFDAPIKYVESAFFGDDLERRLRFSYPTKIFDSITFEVDDTGKPYYIVSCSSAKVSLFGAMDIKEVIVFDPATAESEIYPVGEVPSWIDIVYTGELACQKYNWQGTLAGGFINSIIGNKGCKITTDDFGFIALNDDVWYFTGVTSVTGDDMSNIGFILSNARTGEYKFYPVIGAEEHSAMNAAQGEVQEKGYVASFPSLVNVSGEATYIMVLKDDAGIVKLYALVNVENYSIVSTGSTQAEAMTSYKKLLKQSGEVNSGADEITATVTVELVRIVTQSGLATVYVTADNGVVYKGYLDSDESLILIRTGDVISITSTDGSVNGIKLISKWSFVE